MPPGFCPRPLPLSHCANSSTNIAINARMLRVIATPPGLDRFTKVPELCLFKTDDHRLFAGQRLGPHVAETGSTHPANALGRSEISAIGSHDQHVEAGEQAGGV